MVWSRLPSRASHSRTKPSKPVVTMDRPSGLKSRSNTPPLCASTCQRTVQLLVSNTFNWLPPAASRDPSGLKAIWPADVAGGSRGNSARTERSSPRTITLGCWSPRMRTATSDPSGEIAAPPQTHHPEPHGSPKGPTVATTEPVSRSHTDAATLWPPAATYRPSGVTDGGVPVRQRHHGADSASRIDGPRADLPGAQIEGHRLTERLRGEVPHTGGPVAPERGQPVALVVHRQPQESTLLADQRDEVRPGGRVPDPSGPVEARRVGKPAVLAECNVGGAGLLTGQEPQGLAGGGIHQLHRSLGRGRGRERHDRPIGAQEPVDVRPLPEHLAG